jgi:hypothetical protein
MNKIKKFNRNAFSEKMIHRYLFERYYFSDKVTQNSLLPQEYRNGEINLVVPEENTDKESYRADLSIYFKKRVHGVPVEVKWSAKDLKEQNQIEYLKKNNGFLVSFSQVKEDKYKGVNHVAINTEDFQNWIAQNISKLTRESLAYQTEFGESAITPQYWIVFLRNTGHINFERMLKQYPTANFWAFNQQKEALKNILDIQKGDYCLFLLGIDKEAQKLTNKTDKKIEYVAWYSTRIKEPYFMDLNSERSTFFEKSEIPINERKWPHFISFSIIERYEPQKRMLFGERGELAEALKFSNNRGGVPAPLTRRQWDSLIDRLHLIREKNSKI